MKLDFEKTWKHVENNEFEKIDAEMKIKFYNQLKRIEND